MRGLAAVCSVSLALVVALGGLGVPRPAFAKERHALLAVGLGITAWAATIPYGALKSVYAIGGTVTGGLAWALTGGRDDIARAIIQPSVRGDYVVVPENLTLERPLAFSGMDPLTPSDTEDW